MNDPSLSVERHLPALAVAELIARLSGPVLLLLALRFLGPSEFGNFSLLLSFLTLAQLLSGLGLSKSLIQQDQGQADARALWSTLQTVATVGGSLWLASIGLALWLGPRSDVALGPAHVAALGSIIPFGALVLVLEAWLQRRQRFQDFSRYRLITGLLPGILTLAGAWAGFGIWALIAASTLTAVLQLVYLIGSLQPEDRYPQVWVGFVRHYRFGLWTLGESFIGWGFSWADTLAVAYFLGTPSAGAYKLAWTILDLSFSTVTAPLTTAAYPTFCRQDSTALQTTFLRLVGLAAGVTLPMGIFYFLSGPQLVHLLLGPSWGEAGLSVKWIGLCYGTVGFTILNAELFRARNRPELSSVFGAISLCSYLPVYLVLCPLGLWPLLAGRIGITIWGTFWHLVLAGRVLGEATALWKTVGRLSACFAAGLALGCAYLYLLPNLPALVHVAATLAFIVPVFLLLVRQFHRGLWDHFASGMRLLSLRFRAFPRRDG